jgi:hypothetical protein
MMAPALPVARPLLTSARARRLAALAGAAVLSGCYSNDYLEGLCENTGFCPEPPPESPVAFRITSLELVDPHTYTLDLALNVCTDSTDTLNSFIATGIKNYEVSNTLVLRPLDPDSVVSKLQFVSALCIPGEPTNCTDRMASPMLNVNTDAFNQQGGACGGAEPNSLNAMYTGLHKPQGPCFVSAQLDLVPLRLAAQPGQIPLDLRLNEVKIAAAYAVDGTPQRLVQGTIKGFIPAANAMVSSGQSNGTDFVLWKFLAGGEGCEIDASNVFSDLDNHGTYGQGVWMYFNFTAERVQWATDVPEPMPGTTGGDTTTGEPTGGTTADASTSTATVGTSG